MKKIIAIASMAAMVAGAAFAADANASLYQEGSLLNGSDGGDTTFFTLNNTNQKDADLIQFSFNGEKAGAAFRLWAQESQSDALASATTAVTVYVDTDGDGTISDAEKTAQAKNSATATTTVTSSGDAVVRFRSFSMWFKPVDMLKISVGNVGQYTYTERLHWWKDPVGSSASNASGWWLKYSNYSGIEGAGVNLTLTPIAGLTVDLGIAPGFGNTFADFKTKTTGAWGTTVKYQITEDISAAVAYRDAGNSTTTSDEGAWNNTYKSVSIGADYGKWGAPVYQFINARMLFGSNFKMSGIAFDNYGYCTAGALKVEYRFPFILRTAGTDSDPSWMLYDVKASYAMDGFTPYIEIDNEENFVPLQFGSSTNTVADTFSIDVKPGVSFSVGEAALDVSFCFIKNVKSAASAYSWSMPFTMRVSF